MGRRHAQRRVRAAAPADGARSGGGPNLRRLQRAGGTLAATLLRVSLLIVQASGTIPSLTEADFAERLRGSTSALVAFIAPWCLASQNLIAELVRVRDVLAQRPKDVLVAQCDVSRELHLAAKYRAWRSPIVVLFPDTRFLAPGLQVNFNGHLLHGNIVAFVNGAHEPLSTHVHSPETLLEAVDRRGEPGLFVGFFRSSDEDSLLQGVWTMDCVRRHRRAVALAHGPAMETGEQLWRWAGLHFDPDGSRSEEAVVFVPVRSPACEAAPTARFTLAKGAGASVAWRVEVERFCAWCERQVLAPVAVFDAARAAALDGTFEWLLLLFATRGSTQDEEEQDLGRLFPTERRRLERFVVAACAQDRRYHEVLPVLVPWGEEEIPAFRGYFGVDREDPTEPMQRHPDVSATPAACHGLPAGGADQDDGAVDAGPGRRRRAALWAAALFNTRTRLRYPVPRGRGWCPGDELALCRFTDAALDGRLPPHFRSLERPAAEARNGPPLGVTELVGSTFGHEAVRPIAAGLAEVLLLVYAPWCSHSIHFQPLWRSLAASVAQTASEERREGPEGGCNASSSPAALGGPANGKELSGQAGRLLLAQMDGTQNEHPDLPHVDRFPTVFLGVRSAPPLVGNSTEAPAAKWLPERGSAVRFLAYGGEATLSGLQSWVARHSVLQPPHGDSRHR